MINRILPGYKQLALKIVYLFNMELAIRCYRIFHTVQFLPFNMALATRCPWWVGCQYRVTRNILHHAIFTMHSSGVTLVIGSTYNKHIGSAPHVSVRLDWDSPDQMQAGFPLSQP